MNDNFINLKVLGYYFRLNSMNITVVQPKKDIIAMYIIGIASYIIFNLIHGNIQRAICNGIAMFMFFAIFVHVYMYSTKDSKIEELLKCFKTLKTRYEKEQFIDSCKKLLQ